ncbi:hypothetical protein KY289_016507 [Solanum tuberosum]|nr:hypothetical protein KY289_016507 [Solanum tuberosum]
MRTLKWDLMFDPEEETSTAIAWISFPSLPPNVFGNETLFSMAAAVEKPLQVDMAMKNQTRPSCARVKVEADLLSELPKRISIGMRQPNGNVQEKWIKIKYDYIHKYCTTCMIQGHDEQQCYVNHPDLHPARQKEKTMEIGENKAKEGTELGGTMEKRESVGIERRVEGYNDKFHEKWQEKRGRMKKKTNQVWNKVGVTTTNKYDAFQEKDEDYMDTEQQENIVEQVGITKQWVNETFYETSKKLAKEDNQNRGNHKEGNERNTIMEVGVEIDTESQEVRITDGPTKEQTHHQGDSGQGTRDTSDMPMVVVGTHIQHTPGRIELANFRNEHSQEVDEDEGLNENINYINIVGDLSPRHVDSLKKGIKKGKSIIPLQVRTMSNKESILAIDQ